MKGIFRIRFDDETVKNIDKKDGVYSLFFYLYYLVIIFLFGMLMYKTEIYDSLSGYFNSKSFFRFLFNIPMSIVSILPIFIILFFKRQAIDTIGIKKMNIGKSVLIGIIGSIPFSIVNIIGAVSEGKHISPNPTEWLWRFLYYLICIAFVEEIAFRGFLQTRILGFIRNKWLSIVIVGVLFGLMHVPFQMIRANMSPIDFLINDLPHLITTMVIHIYLVWLYTRDNNILAPTLAHAIMNFSYNIFI